MRIKTLLRFKGMTQVELARITHMSTSRINRIVNEKIEISGTDVVLISAVLEVSIEELLGLRRTFNQLLDAYENGLFGSA